MYLYVCIDVRCIFSHYACACVCVPACFRWACNVTHANVFWVYLIMITCQRTGIKSSGWADFISSIRCQWSMHIPRRIRSCVPHRYIANIRYMCYAYIYCKDALPITHTYIANMRCPYLQYIYVQRVTHTYIANMRHIYIYCKYALHIDILQICVVHWPYLQNIYVERIYSMPWRIYRICNISMCMYLQYNHVYLHKIRSTYVYLASFVASGQHPYQQLFAICPRVSVIYIISIFDLIRCQWAFVPHLYVFAIFLCVIVIQNGENP